MTVVSEPGTDGAPNAAAELRPAYCLLAAPLVEQIHSAAKRLWTIVLLTQLCKDQHATVLQLPVTSPVPANEAQRHGSLVA